MDRVNLLLLLRFLLIFPSLILAWAGIAGANENDEFIRQQEWRLSQERNFNRDRAIQSKPRVIISIPPYDETKYASPSDARCFQIRQIKFESEIPSELDFLNTLVQPFMNSCLNQVYITQLVNKLNRRLLSRGYVTSRVLLGEQNLSEGVLKLTLFEGRLNTIVLPKGYTKSWKTAFPIRSGDLLNIRHLEQGLEQMKRLSSQDVTMQIVPADDTGMSDVRLEVKEGFQGNASIAIDDSAGENVGKYQTTLSLGWDNLFYLQDNFSGSFTKANKSDSDDASESYNLSYSVPMGYFLFSVASNQFEYSSLIEGAVQSFVSRGEGENHNIDLTWTAYRSQASKFDIYAGLGLRTRSNYINDTEIEVQRRRLANTKLGVRHRYYLSNSSLNWGVELKQGSSWFNAESERQTSGSSTPNYDLLSATLAWNRPSQIFNQPGVFSTSLRGQWTKSELFSMDWFSVGGRYSVRGFDAGQTLAAQKGWHVRNELGLTLKQRHTLFMLLDGGGVRGEPVETYSQSWLASTGFGARGSVGSLYYDAHVAYPISHPNEFKDISLAGGFALTWTL